MLIERGRIVKRKGIIILFIVCLLGLSFALYRWYISDEFAAFDDEIALQIKLDIKEDIGLIIIDYDVNGSKGSGGISNADKTMIKHDELLIYTLSKSDFNCTLITVINIFYIILYVSI